MAETMSQAIAELMPHLGAPRVEETPQADGTSHLYVEWPSSGGHREWGLYLWDPYTRSLSRR